MSNCNELVLTAGVQKHRSLCQGYSPIFPLIKHLYLTPYKLLIRHSAHIRLSPFTTAHCIISLSSANCNEVTTFMGMAWAGKYTKGVQKVQPEPEVVSLCTLIKRLYFTPRKLLVTSFSTHHKLLFLYLTSTHTVPSPKTGDSKDQCILVKTCILVKVQLGFQLISSWYRRTLYRSCNSHLRSPRCNWLSSELPLCRYV